MKRKEIIATVTLFDGSLNQITFYDDDTYYSKSPNSYLKTMLPQLLETTCDELNKAKYRYACLEELAKTLEVEKGEDSNE